MNTRISTSGVYQQSLSTMLAKQAGLSHTQQQLATGLRLVTAKDDPVAAGTAVALDRASAELERFGENANLLGNRLNLQESVLAQAGERLARVRELTIQANNASLSSDDKKAITAELKVIREELLGLANVEFVHAGIEELPLPDQSVDVVITNGVLNLCPDKPKVLAEAYRVLRPGGRLQMADILLEEGVTPDEVARKGSWSD